MQSYEALILTYYSYVVAAYTEWPKNVAGKTDTGDELNRRLETSQTSFVLNSFSKLFSRKLFRPETANIPNSKSESEFGI